MGTKGRRGGIKHNGCSGGGLRLGMIGLGVVIASGVAPAFAAGVEVPSSVSSERMEERLLKSRPEAPQAPVILQPLDAGSVPPNGDFITFTLSGVDIKGATAYPVDDFAALFRPYVGTTMTLTQALKVAQGIADKYERDGYLLTHVVFPVQDLSKGSLQITVKEFVAKRVLVRIDGKPVEPDARIKPLLDELARSRPLREADYLKVEKVLDTLPDLRLMRTAEAGPEDGPFDGVIDFRRRVAGQAKIEAEVRPGLTPADPPRDAEKIRFKLRQVQIEGATVFGEADFLPLYRDLLDKEVTLLQVHELTKAIADKYDAADYIETRVTLPAQVIAEGRVKIKVGEMRVSHVDVKVDDKPLQKGDLLYDMANKIPKTGLLRADEVDHYLMLMTDQPGIQPVEASAPDEPGGPGLIRVARKPIEGSVGFDNRGERIAGKDEYTASLTFNSPLGLEDRLVVDGAAAGGLDEFRSIGAKYSLPIGTEGTRITLGASHSEVEPGASFNSYAAQSLGDKASVEVSHPFIRQTAETVRGFVKFDYSNGKDTYVYDGVRILDADNHVRSLRVGARYSSKDKALFNRRGSNKASVIVSQGLHVLNATPNNEPDPDTGKPGPDTDYRKISVSAERLQKLTGSLGVLVAASAQYGFDRLPGSEKLTFGGPDFGRGYYSGAFQGDSAAFGKVEFQYDYEVGFQYLQGVQFFASYDHGVGWTRDLSSDFEEPRTAASIAAGTRLMLTESLSSDLEVSRGLAADGVDENTHFFVSLTYQF